jgi:hypothetical protein
MTSRQSALRRHKEHLTLYLEHRTTALPAPARAQLLGALSGSRGDLVLLGHAEMLGRGEEEVVAALSRRDIQSVVRAMDIAELQRRLKSFVRLSGENGGDVALIESDDERDAAGEAGRMLLWDRHELECRLTGLGWVLKQRRDLRPGTEAALKRLRGKLLALDDLWKHQLRHFVTFNASRKMYRKTYRHPKRFWWWHLYADCDLDSVYRSAEGGKPPSRHIRACPLCSELLAKLTAVQRMLRKEEAVRVAHPSPEELIQLYCGEMDEQKEQAIEAHVECCASCRWELDALERADRPEPPPPHSETVDLRYENRSLPLKKGGQEGFVDEGFEKIPLNPLLRQGSGHAFPKGEDVLWDPERVHTAVYAPRFVFGRPGASADTDEHAPDPQAEKVYQEGGVEVWLDEVGGRIVLRVYGEGLDALQSVVAMDAETLEQQAVKAVASGDASRAFDIGELKQLYDKRLLVSLRYTDREVRLPRIDIRERKP